MKKHILKNILKGVAAAAAFALASCSFLSLDDDSGSSSGSGSERGAVSVSMFVPDYYAISAGTSARVVAPQTNSVRLGYKAGTAAEYTYLDAISLTSDSVTKTEITGADTTTLSGYTYKFTFSGIPAVTYAANALVVELLDSSNNVVSSGTNSESVTIAAGGSAATASFYTIPTSSDAASGSLSAGEMKFAKVTQAAGKAYTLTVSVGTSGAYPTVFVFNSDGTYKSYKSLSDEDNTISFESSDASVSYYLGLYSTEAVSSYELVFATTATLTAAVETTALDKAGTITLYSGNVTKSTVSSASGTTYDTITAALAAIPTSNDTGTYTIALTSGTYEEDGLAYTGTATIKILGLGTATYGTDVVIYGQGSNMGTQTGRPLIEVQGSASVILDSLTLQNSYGTTTGNAQAETLGYDGTGTVAAYNCSFLSGQDTLRTTGKAWFYGCYIEGDVDFLWMERAGTVALYEECVIRAISSRTNAAYFTAPNMAVSSKVGKGLVIYNSHLQAESGLDLYLGRNPWSSGYRDNEAIYNQVAIVGTDFAGESSLKSEIWKNDAGGGSTQYIGFKTDDGFASSSEGYGARISASVKEAEYAGRNNIVNRVYSTTKSKFQKGETIWDINSVPTENEWTVTEDNSKYFLDGEVESIEVVYDFSSASANGYTDTNVTLTGFAYESPKTHASGAAGSTISFPVTGNAAITVFGYYAGYGTIQAGEQGVAIYDFNNGSTNSTIEKSYINYSGATTVTVTAATSSYIKKIVVEYDDSLSYTPVSSIEISSSSTTEIVGVGLTLSASVSPDNATNSDVLWSSGNETVGTIDQYSGKVTFLAAGNVTFTATAADGSGVTAKKTCNPIKADWTWAEWYTTDTTLDAEGENAKYFGFGSSSNKGLADDVTFTTMDGTSVKTKYGLKLNSSGTLVISTLSPATLTLVVDSGTANVTAVPKVTGATAGAVEASSSDTTSSLYTYVYHLDSGDTWTIERSNTSKENHPIVYAKVIYDTVVDWHDSTSMGYDSKTSIQNTTGTITSATSGIELSVDATSGKLTARGSDAQFNAGTIITVPVNADSVLTVVSYPDYYNFTVGGVAATANTTTYTATKDGYVSIIATGGAYLYSITATNVTSLVDHTTDVAAATGTYTVTIE